MFRFILFLCLVSLEVYSDLGVPRFDGVLGSPRRDIWNLNHHARFFLPYNPIVLEIGAFEGAGTLDLAGRYPYGTIYAFEPNPRAFESLASRIEEYPNVKPIRLALADHNGHAVLYVDQSDSERHSSLLKYENHRSRSKCVQMEVSCLTIQDWCGANGIRAIDFIRVDVEEYELQVLMSSEPIVKQAKVICAATSQSLDRRGGTRFYKLKRYRESLGFEMMSHWYIEGKKGEATFVRKEYYDSIFR